MKYRRKVDLVQIIRRWSGQPHQIAALNMLQEALPPELLHPTCEWIDCWYSDGTGAVNPYTIETKKQ